jgi:hypothetical protein
MKEKKEEAAYMRGFMEGYSDGLKGKYNPPPGPSWWFPSPSDKEDIARGKGYSDGWKAGQKDREK